MWRWTSFWAHLPYCPVSSQVIKKTGWLEIWWLHNANVHSRDCWGKGKEWENRYILERLKTHIVWHKCDFLAQKKTAIGTQKKHDFIILLLSGQNRDVLFVYDFSEVLINKPGKKQLKNHKPSDWDLPGVCLHVCVSLLSSLQSEDEQWWASVGKWLSERGHQKKSNTLALFLCSQMALQRADFPSSHFQPAFCRSSMLRPQIQIAGFFCFFYLSCSTPSTLRMVWAEKCMKFIMDS